MHRYNKYDGEWWTGRSPMTFPMLNLHVGTNILTVYTIF